MQTVTCYLDFISPYAYLAFEQLPHALQGNSYQMVYRPVLFGAMLKHHGQLGPAEIEAKKRWTFRQVAWHARTLGVAIQAPAQHPFNPLALLRLALACGEGGACNRYVTEQVFRHVWHGGANAACPERLAALAARLKPARDPQDAAVKAQLQANTDEAIALGVFGVPSFVVGDSVFWGLDALPMLAARLQGDAWFASPDWVDRPPEAGVVRQRGKTPSEKTA